MEGVQYNATIMQRGGAPRPLGLLMTGRQLSNIMEYHVRPDVRRAVPDVAPPPRPLLPPPAWRTMTAADADAILERGTAVALNDAARLAAAPPCARSASGLPGVSTLVMATDMGERMTLLDRLEHALVTAIEGGADCDPLVRSVADSGWEAADIVAAFARLAETGAILIRD